MRLWVCWREPRPSRNHGGSPSRVLYKGTRTCQKTKNITGWWQPGTGSRQPPLGAKHVSGRGSKSQRQSRIEGGLNSLRDEALQMIRYRFTVSWQESACPILSWQPTQKPWAVGPDPWASRQNQVHVWVSTNNPQHTKSLTG